MNDEIQYHLARAEAERGRAAAAACAEAERAHGRLAALHDERALLLAKHARAAPAELAFAGSARN